MSNRRFTEYSQRSVGRGEPMPPAPGNGRGPTPIVSIVAPPYSSAGPGGPDMNVVGFSPVKAHMAAKMSPEEDPTKPIMKAVSETTPAGGAVGNALRSLGEQVTKGAEAIGRAIGLKQEQKKPPVRGQRDADQEIDDLIRSKGGKQKYSQ